MGKTSHPPGFRFHPTDEELFMFYLKRKVMGKKIPPDVITELDVYKFVPQDLPDKSCLKSRDLEWYFFCPIERKYGVGDRWKRTTESGFWKTTGKDRKVESNNRTVGQIRTLIFHYGRASQRGGDRTDWVMHEYRLEDEDLAGKGIAQDAFVLCKIFQKSGRGPKNGAQYGAPFNEEEWESEDEADDQIESLPCTCSFAPAIVLNDNQSSSISRGVVGHGDTLSGFPSCSGPSQTLPSADQVLPSVPDDDVPELQTEDEFLAMFDAFQDDDILDICAFNENDENEVCKPSHAQNVDDALHVEGNDIFEDLGDLHNLAEMNKTKISPNQWSFHDSFLELRDLDRPLNSPAEGSGSGFVLPGDVSMGYDSCNNSEHFDHQRNDFGVTYHASASIPSTPVLADRSYGFENQKDAFPEKCVGANVVEQGYLGYGSASHNKKRPEPDGGHGSQGQKRGKQQQTKSYSRLQQLIESIPNRPASAAERPGSSNGLRKDMIITIMCPRKEAAPPLACWDGNFMFVLFLGLLSALMWLFIAAIIVKLGRCVWDLLLT